MSCTRSQEFLAKEGAVVGETVIANKVRLGPDEALAMARQARDIWVSRGKKVVHVRPEADAPGDEELLALLLGSSGKLRAPTIRVGKTLLVGFHPEPYQRLLGKK